MSNSKFEEAPVNQELMDDVIAGLSVRPRSIPSKWLYDETGSAIFEEITQVQDYYLPRSEAEIFQTAFPELATKFPDGGAIVEFGSGASVKTRKLLEVLRPAVYVPVDVSREFLFSSAAKLQSDYVDVNVMPVVADLTQPYDLPQEFISNPLRMGFFPGSTIGNFTEDVAIAFLEFARKAMGAGAYLLLSADLVKDHDILNYAYDDRDGVTRRFTMNLLRRINRECNATFDLEGFQHFARYNAEMSRIEIFLESQRDQVVTLGGKEFVFKRADRIRTEYSYKYTPDGLKELLSKAGWDVQNVWLDNREWFSVVLARC